MKFKAFVEKQLLLLLPLLARDQTLSVLRATMMMVIIKKLSAEIIAYALRSIELLKNSRRALIFTAQCSFDVRCHLDEFNFLVPQSDSYRWCKDNCSASSRNKRDLAMQTGGLLSSVRHHH